MQFSRFSMSSYIFLVILHILRDSGMHVLLYCTCLPAGRRRGYVIFRVHVLYHFSSQSKVGIQGHFPSNLKFRARARVISCARARPPKKSRFWYTKKNARVAAWYQNRLNCNILVLHLQRMPAARGSRRRWLASALPPARSPELF